MFGEETPSMKQYCAAFLFAHKTELEKFLAIPGNDRNTRHSFGPWDEANVDKARPPQFRVCRCGYTEWKD